MKLTEQMLAVLLISVGLAGAQPAKTPAPVEQPNAERTRESLSQLLERYPPSLRSVLALDPSLLTNKAYMEPYPALASFLNEHAEVAHNPSFYVGNADQFRSRNKSEEALDLLRDILGGLIKGHVIHRSSLIVKTVLIIGK